MTDGLSMFTLYCSPDDYPGLYVLRRFVVGRELVATGDVVTDVHAEPLRALMPRAAGLMHPARATSPCASAARS